MLTMDLTISALLLHVDLRTFYFNLFLILIAVLTLIFLFFSTLAAITLIRAWLLIRKRRQAEAKWQRASRRADGQPYPCRVPGTCDRCRRGGNHLFVAYGMTICPACYEPYWRKMEDWSGPTEIQELLTARARRQPRRSSSGRAVDDTEVKHPTPQGCE